MKIISLLLLCPLLSFSQNDYPDQRGLDIGLKATLENWHKEFEHDGHIIPSPHVSQNTFELESEYGFAKQLNAFIHVPFLMNAVKADPDFDIPEDYSVSGIGDAEAGVRFRFPEVKDFKFSVFVLQSFGTGDDDKKYQLNTGYGDFSQMAGVTARYQKERLILQAEGGFRSRKKGYGDEISGEAEINFMLINNLWIFARTEGIQPIENGDDSKMSGPGGTFNQYEGFWNSGGGFLYQAGKSLEFAASLSGNYKGQFSPSAPVFRLDIRFSFNGSANEE